MLLGRIEERAMKPRTCSGGVGCASGGILGRMTDLLGGRAGSSLLSFAGPIVTLSNLPGRVRFRSQVVVSNETVKATLSDTLPRIQGVRSVEVNVTSGSVLIRYNPETITPDVLFVALLKLLDLEEAFLNPPPPLLARELRDVGQSVNRAVYDLTGGLADLKTLLMVGFFAVGAYKLRQQGFASIPSPVALLWWAYIGLA